VRNSQLGKGCGDRNSTNWLVETISPPESSGYSGWSFVAKHMLPIKTRSVSRDWKGSGRTCIGATEKADVNGILVYRRGFPHSGCEQTLRRAARVSAYGDKVFLDLGDAVCKPNHAPDNVSVLGIAAMPNRYR
jgi:hypothetical protein